LRQRGCARDREHVRAAAGLRTCSTDLRPRRRLRGSLVTPRDEGWAAARALYNARLDVEPPVTRAARSSTRSTGRSTARGRMPPRSCTAAQRLHCAYLSFWGTGDPPAMAAA